MKHSTAIFLGLGTLLCSACATSPERAEEVHGDLTEDFSGPFYMPELPEHGWKWNGVSWTQTRMELADHNGDGRFDYFRWQKPPGGYTHWVWFDRDGDGFFDEGCGRPIEGDAIAVPVMDVSTGSLLKGFAMDRSSG